MTCAFICSDYTICYDLLMRSFSGYTIPKGWRVLVWFRSVHLDPEIYENPKEFKPSRWDVSKASSSHTPHPPTPTSPSSNIQIRVFCSMHDICLRICFHKYPDLLYIECRILHPKQEPSFPLEREVDCAREMILLSWKFLFSFTIFSLITS